MSVHYTLNKPIKIKDLKEKGFKIETHENPRSYPITIESDRYYEEGSWVGTLDINLDDDLLTAETQELEGHTGFAVIIEICETFNVKFLTDTYIDNKILDADKNGTVAEITDEDFDKCMDYYYKKK
jgi:hypothetical protein